MSSRDHSLISLGHWVGQEVLLFWDSLVVRGQHCLAYEQRYKLFPPLEEMSLLIAQTLKSKEKSPVVLAKLDSWVVSLCSHSVSVARDSLQKTVTPAARRTEYFPHTLS